MSGKEGGKDGEEALHPRVEAAARGRLPAWARAGPERRAHMQRVADLMAAWARARGRHRRDELRWRAGAWLHDALRDAAEEELRPEAPPGFQDLPGPLLHGPVAAERLRREGVEDEELLRAVAFHTLGDPGFDDLGLALFCADFLEPGRSFRRAWREELRARMPGELEEVARDVTAARIRHRLDESSPVDPRTWALWNRLAAPSPEPRGAREGGSS